MNKLVVTVYKNFQPVLCAVTGFVKKFLIFCMCALLYIHTNEHQS